MFLAAQHSGGEFLVLVPSSSLMDGWRQQIEQHTLKAEKFLFKAVLTAAAFDRVFALSSSSWPGVRVQMQQENGVLREVRSRIATEVYRSVGY